MKHVLTGKIITILISENQYENINNKTEIKKLGSKLPLAVALLNKHVGSTIKLKKSMLDEQVIYVEVLDVNNGFNSESEIVIIESDNLEKEDDLENQDIEVEPIKKLEPMGARNFEYQSTRLTFLKGIIDKMKEDDILTISVLGADNPDNNGKFRMTKHQIYQTFDNVIRSESYKKGNYNYKKTPNKAQQYRVG